MQYKINKNLEYQNIEKIPIKSIAQRITITKPHLVVKSYLEKKANAVALAVTPNVIIAAINTTYLPLVSAV